MTLAVLGFTSNDSIIWSPTSNLILISEDSVSVSPTTTTIYTASVYSKVITNGEIRLACPVSLNFTVTVNPLPDPVMTSTTVICNNDGTATATPVAGTYNFVWSNGVTDLAAASSTITSLPAGTFCVTVTDNATGCVDTGCVFVAPNVNVPIVFVNNVTAITCAGADDGTATIGTANGTAPFSYVWDTIVPGIPGTPISVNYTVTGLPPRDYTVTSTDNLGCVSVITFNVLSPDSLMITVLDTIHPVCESSLDGRIEV